MENHSKADTRKGGAPKEKRAALAESEEESEPLSPINIGSEAPLPSEFEFPDALELRKIESDTQNRLKAILEVAGVTGLSQIDARTFQDPEILRKLTNSVSSALDEAATALTRMKSDRQTYEAFLRGANQAPSPSPLHPSAGGAAIAPHGQQQQHQHHHPASASAGGPPQQANNSGEKMTGNVTLKRSQHQPLPQQQQQGGVPHPSQSSHQGTGGHQDHGGRSQSHHHHAHHHAPQQQQQQQQQGQGASPAVSTTPPTNPNDSMQTVQRLLTQGHSIQEASEDGESLLSLACSAGYYELAEVLLRMRASVEDRGIKGDSTPLMEAASGGYADIVKLLIDHGANVNAKSSVGNTALTYACCGGYEDVVKILLDAGADVEHQNENGHTPLMEAASCGHVGVAKLLLQYGANINTHSNEFKESALTLACYKGHLEMVKFLLSAGADQEHKTDEMHTALMEASMDGHVDVARLLLDHGAQVNMPVDSFESPLTLAACGGHYELAALLISRGADLEEVNDEGYTPLMEAAREGHEDVVQLLVEHGANVNAQTEETQETALTLACCGGFMEVVQYLIEHGADIELGASTPLMEASQEGHVNIVKFLLERGAKVHAETSTGDTALTYACANGHTLIASILLQCGAELEHESEGGRTPLMKAARAGHLQTIQFLVTKGADVNRSTTNNDHTVLSLASAGGHVSVVQYLLIRGAEPSYCLRDGSTMLIEAARGGHTSVVNLLLRQPLMKRRQQLEQASAMAADSRKLAAMSAAVSGARNKHASSSSTSATPSNTATPAAVDSSANTSGGTAQANSTTTSAASGGGGNQTSGTGKTLSSTTTTTLQHISPPPPSSEELSQQQQQQQQVQDATSGGAPVVMVPATTTTSSAGSGDQQQPQKAGLSVSTGSSGAGGGGSAPLQHPAKSKLVQKSGGKQQQQQQGNNGGREAGAYPQQQQELPSDSGGGGTDKGITSSLSSRKGAGGGGGSDLIGAKRPKMSSTTEPCPTSSSLLAGMTPQQQQHISTLLATPTKMKMVDSDLSYVVTPPSTSAAASPGGVVSSAFSPGHYTTDSATALKNMQRLTSNANSPLKSGVMATSEVGTSVDVPPLLHSPQTHMVNSTHVNSNEVTLPSTQLTPDDIIQGHMTADDIVARYWQQQNISELSSSKHMAGESKANGARDEENAAQRMFSSGNFSTLPPHPVSLGQAAGYHHPSRFHASSSAMGIPPGAAAEGEGGGGDPQSLLVNSLSTGEHSNNSVDSDAGTGITQAPSVDSHPLSNVDLTRLIPHLEALAGSLQNQSPLETHQYLAALAAQSSHLLHPPPVSTEDGNIDVPPDIGADENDVSLPPLDPAALFSAAEIAKLLPNLASLGADSQSDGAADFRTVATGAPSAVSVATTTTTTATGLPYPSKYRPSMSTVRYMSRKFAGIAEMAGLTSADVGAGPDPGGGGGGVAMGVVGAGSEEEGSEIDVDLLHQDPTRSLPPSLLLDNKFPLDIPPPSDLVPPENLLPTGYDGSLENESYPTSDEEEEPDEDESVDSSYLAPHMSNLMPGFEPAIDIDQQTDSNHDTALTLAAAGGHDELVELLLNHGAKIEHRDKKGCTPLILAASAGHAVTVAILLDHNADIEAQSDRTKDTALSLACSGGRQEVVELLLAKGANFEHRNVSDYTPLSLAASGGYVNIIKLLLRAGADINSRTGSKLGISPLMLAAMNGHTSTVKLLLDMGSDINAQIETNRNTALTLACFQGRHEVVNLLVERQANVEHRAKTGLTPLMEAASGGYYEVGKVLISKGADVNAAPVPSSKDTALTIAADKGHYKFVELILKHGANVDVKNKKGNSPLWLAANGGHLDVIRLLIEHSADVDSQDNRKVSCLMAAFRRGHFKVVKFLVDHVSQFPSDSELTRYIGTLSDKELLKKTQRCMEVIIDAKERQAAEANKNATILLQEIDLEKKHEEDRRAAAARKREKKKRKKEKKKAQKEAESEKGNGATGGDTPPEYEAEGNGGGGGEPSQLAAGGADEGDDDVIETTEPVPKIPEPPDRTEATKSNKKQDHQQNTRRHEQNRANKATELRDENQPPPNNRASSLSSENQVKNTSKDGEKPQGEGPGTRPIKKTRSRAGSERSSSGNIASSKVGSGSQLDSAVPSSSPRKGKREEGWKEVGRRTKKVSIPGILFPQIVGKNSCNLAAIRQATSTQIDIDRHGKQSSNRTITVRGSADAIKQVHHLILVLIQDPNQDIHQLLTKFAGASSSSSSSAAASSSSAHRRHVTSSSHDPTPSVPPLETFEVASDAQPAKANPTATSASAAAAPTSTTVGTVLRSNYRKSGSVSSISTISSSLPPSSSSVSGKPSASLTQSLGGSFNVRVSAQGLATASGDNKSHHHHQGTSSLLDSHHHHGGGGSGDPSIHSVAAPVSTRVPTSGSISVNVKQSSHQHSQQQAIGSGPVRRLFTSGPSSHQPPAQLISTPAAPSSASVANPTRSTTTTAMSGAAVSLVRTASGHTIPTGKVSVAPPAPGSGRAHPASQASKLSSSRPHEVSAGTSKQSVTYPVLLMGSEKQQQLSAPPPSHVVKSQVTIGGPPTAASGAAVSMSYSRVINAAAISAVQDSSTQLQAQQSQSQQQQMLGGEVIEQPLQQIMKTPMIFQDPAAQIAKAKKKSTYSDAVGKKSGVSSVVGANVAINGAPSGMVGMATVVPSSAVAVSSSGTAGVLQTAPQVSSQQIMTSAQQHKINLAPGSRPTTEMNPQLSGVGVGGVMDKQRSRAAPWSEVTAGGGGTVPSGSDKAHHPAVAAAPTATGVYEDVEHEGGVASSERGAHLPHLGPIGPPSKSIKTGQSGFISGPSSAGKQSSSSSGRSFSPAGSRPKTSPTALNTSPHRNEHSPAAKSPLLGTAPPGLLPPPDKGGGVYSTAFRPIQQHPEGDSSSNIPTLVPTPLRNSRPPLLETPPGFRIMSQGIRQQKPSSPVPSPEKSSPNKSPPVQAIKGFNPNAPTFVPMALQNQRPTNPPTSSILGAPPTPKFPVFGPSGGASILGSAPQLPPGPSSMYGGGGNQQPRMMSPAPPFSNQPGPPPPPPPQMVQTAAFIQQQPPPPPPLQGGQHQVAPPPPGPPQQQQPPLTQSSLLGQPPSAPMSHPVFGGSGGGPPPPPPAFQTIQTRPPGPPHPAAGQGGMPPHPPQTPLYGHQIEGAPPPLPPPPPGGVGGASGPPSAGLIQQQPPQGPTPFSINLVPFASGVDPPPIGTSGAQPHPGQPNSATGDVPKFGLQNLMYFKPNADGAVPSDSTQQSMMFATAGGSAVGPHFETVGGPPLPATPSGIISSRTPGPENLFNHLNLGQLGAMGGAETVPDESNQSPSFQSAGASNGFPQYPYLHQQQPNQEIPTPSSSLTSVGGSGGGGVIFTPSSNFIVMTPGVFTTATAGFTSTSGQPLTSQTGGGGATEVGDGLLPIGTERAHKSSTLPAAFSMLAPGNVWSYSGNPSSEGSDWAKVGSEASDWPSAVPLPPSSAGTTSEPAAGHKLESVLEKLGFSEYLPLFQKNEIDLDALQLMSEKEFTEIGLPTSPTHKLLSALQQSSPQTSTSATAEEPSPPPPGGVARNTTSGSSTPPSEAAPVVSTPSKQHAASQ